jgi:hypothetical protein
MESREDLIIERREGRRRLSEGNAGVHGWFYGTTIMRKHTLSDKSPLYQIMEISYQIVPSLSRACHGGNEALII